MLCVRCSVTVTNRSLYSLMTVEIAGRSLCTDVGGTLGNVLMSVVLCTNVVLCSCTSVVSYKYHVMYY